MSVAVQDVFPSQWNLFVGNADVVAQPNHRRQGKIWVNLPVYVLNLLCFFLDEKHNGPAPACNIQRLIGGIEH